jgi:phytoene/squalene synthetase
MQDKQFSTEQKRLFSRKARRHSRDLFLATLTFPYAVRPQAQLLLAVVHEFHRATRITAEPLLSMIRLTWWREAIEEITEGKRPRAHEFVAPLAILVNQQPEIADFLLEMVAAHAQELEPEQWDSAEKWEEYLQQTTGNILRCWACLLGDSAPAGLCLAAAKSEVALSLLQDARHGRVRVPEYLCRQAGIAHTAHALQKSSHGLSFLCLSLCNDAMTSPELLQRKKIWGAVAKVVYYRCLRLQKCGARLEIPQAYHVPLSLYFSLLFGKNHR